MQKSRAVFFAARRDPQKYFGRAMLNAKEERFCQEYAVDLNATRAAIRAGYSDNTDSAAVQGSRLLGNVKVQERIEALQSDAAAAARVNAAFVLSRLVATAERCMQAVPVRDREGRETGTWKFDSAGAIRALEMLGKHLGLFVERREVSGPKGGQIQMVMDSWTDEQLQAALVDLYESEHRRRCPYSVDSAVPLPDSADSLTLCAVP